MHSPCKEIKKKWTRSVVDPLTCFCGLSSSRQVDNEDILYVQEDIQV